MSQRSRPTTEKGIRQEWINGRWVYRLQLQRSGKRGQRIFATLLEACRAKDQWLREGIPDVPPMPEPPPATVEDGLREYADGLAAAKKGAARVRQLIPVLRRELPAFLATPIDLVAVEHFAAFRLVREQPRLKPNGETAAIRPNTIRNDLGILRAMVKKARPSFRLPDEIFPAMERRVRFLSPSEQLQVEAGLDVDAHPTLQRLGRLMLLNITRQHDWRMLRRERVHLVERRVEFPASKGTPRDLSTLSDESMALLRAQLESHTSPWVFVNAGTGLPYCRGHVGHVLRQIIRATGRRDFTPHDLKHHAASAYVAHGASDRELQDAAGWKTSKMLPLYAHVRSHRMRDLAERVSGRRSRHADSDVVPVEDR